MEIYTTEAALLSIKPKSRSLYEKAWNGFVQYTGRMQDFESRIPKESELMDYFTYLRETVGRASTTIWTTYSMINAVIKNKYSQKLQDYPRLTNLLKSYDVDTIKKAAVFSTDELRRFFEMEIDDAYWLVRKALVIFAYFGGLRLTEVMDLKVISYFILKLFALYLIFC